MDLGGNLKVLTFLGLQAELQESLFPLPDLPTTLPLLGHFGKWLHNNVNPLVLPRHGVILAIGHDHGPSRKILHGEPAVDGYREIAKTMSYNTYLHYFLLYNATPPHAFLAQSPAFCFPAAPDDALDEWASFRATFTLLRPAAPLLQEHMQRAEPRFEARDVADLVPAALCAAYEEAGRDPATFKASVNSRVSPRGAPPVG